MALKIVPLEDRIMFDAAGAAVVADALAAEQTAAPDAPPDGAHSSDGAPDFFSDAQSDFSVPDLTDEAHFLPSTNDDPVKVFVVPDNNGNQTATSVDDDVLVVRYDAQTTTLEGLVGSISTALQGQEAGSISIATHSESGNFSITANSQVSEQSVHSDATMQSFWQDIGSLVRDGGRVELLGCRTADLGSDLLDEVDSLLDVNGKDISLTVSSNDASGDDVAEHANVEHMTNDDGSEWSEAASGVFESHDADGSTSADLLPVTHTDTSAPETHDLTHESLPITDASLLSQDHVSDPVKVLVVSDSVNDSQTLVAAAASDVVVVTYDPLTTTLDGIVGAITTALHGGQADSISFATHGWSGVFNLTANVQVTEQTIQSDASLQSFWGEIGTLIRDGGSVDLLGCRVAAGGDTMLKAIDSLLDVNGKSISIAASLDDTGSASVGGNWILEYTQNVDVSGLFDASKLLAWDQLLAPAVIVTPGVGLVTTEAGGTATFTIVLANQMPALPVTISLTSSDTTEGTLSVSSVTFTSANWNIAQTITITGVNDFVDDGNIAYTIITGATSSGDPAWNNVNVGDVSVTNTDNDTAGFTVSAISGNTTEAGGTATFTVRLNSQPTANVVVGVSSSDTTEGTVTPSSLTFTTINWNALHTVTVTGVDDFVIDGNTVYSIILATPTSADPKYAAINPPDVSVTNLDNDVAGITVTPTSGLITTEGGGFATFTVRLSSQPTANVTVAVVSDNLAEGTTSPDTSLTFTPANWNTTQTAKVTGVDDFVADGDILYYVTTAATSGDAYYNGIAGPTVSLTNYDNDTAGITVTPSSGLVTTEHGETATFAVVLTSQPTASVTIGLSSSDTTEGTVSTSSLIFTAANWNAPQTVTVTGVSDGTLIDGDQLYTIVTAPAVSSDRNYNTMNAADVSVTNRDNNPPIAQNFTATVVEDVNTYITLVATDVNGDPLTYYLDRDPLAAMVSIVGNQVYYQPFPNYNAGDNFTYHANDGSLNSNIATVTVSFTPVNDVPSFTKGSNQIILEDAGPQTVAGWATNINKGASNESGQVVDFLVSNNNPSLFSVAPAISPTGTLTYTPAPNANGSATITARIHDNGGVANGGVDTSAAQTFTIDVTSVNDAPSFTMGSDQTILEDAGPQTVVGWATNINKGASDESGQIVDFLVSNDNAGLFSVAPVISASGTLTYTPASNANGSATITVQLHDDGGTANSGVDTSAAQTFSINVTLVNDAPSFTMGFNQTILEDAGPQTVAGWATNINKGASNESGQVLDFLVSNDNAGLFSAAPVISPTGALTYTPAPNANGSATITVQLHDDGGTANGGVDTNAAQTFSIDVLSVNDAPSFTGGLNQTILEDAGPQTVVGWARNILPGPATAVDESGQVMDFLVSNNNPSLFSAAPVISSIGTLTYTPASNANGSATITVQLHDNGGVANGGVDTSAAQTFSIDVTAVNDPPTITDILDRTINEDTSTGTISFAIGDVETPIANLTVTATSSNTTLVPNENIVLGGSGILPLRTLVATPVANGNGISTITVTVDDGTTTTFDTFVLTVTPVNDTPILSPLPISDPTTILEDALYTFTATATDPDIGDTQTFSLSGAPAGATIVLNTGVFRWTPTVAQGPGEYSFSVIVTDSGGLTDTQTAHFIVDEVGAYEVTTTSDVVNPADGQTSLREAIIDANAHPGTPHTIIVGTQTYGLDTYNPSNTVYVLSIQNVSGDEEFALTGDLDITFNSNITIVSSGERAVIDARTGVPLNDRVFEVLSGGALTLDNVTITGGSDVTDGGGIYNNTGGTVTVNNSTLSNNTATYGGGGLTNYGTATITSSTLSSNTATNGGGIDNYGTATITNSTLSNNTATNGGGIDNYGTATITNSTLSGNTAAYGGGIYNNIDTLNTALAIITNSTLSGNSATNTGGGIYNADTVSVGSVATVTNSTIVYNDAPNGANIFNSPNGTVSVENTIVANPVVSGTNTSGSINQSPDFNLIQGVLPLLGPLANNGGPTMTHALLPGNAAIDTGGGSMTLGSDQRGAPYDRVVGIAIDIGAFEAPSPLVVTTVADDVDANDGWLSLREALIAANASPGYDAITFNIPNDITNDPNQDGIYVLTITSVLPNVTGPVVIDGSTQMGDPSVIQINGLQLDGVTKLVARGLTFAAGSGASMIRELQITNFGEGGIYNAGTLTIMDSTLSGNSVTAVGGGGIYNAGTVNITNSTLSWNTATTGGGIHNVGTVNITNSTISGNDASQNGGGVFNFGGVVGSVGVVDSVVVTVLNSTIVYNDAPNGANIYNSPESAVSVGNTIVANPVNGTNTDGTIINISPDFNLIWDVLPLDPLAYNGGPTMTHALLPMSPALDAGDPNYLSGPNPLSTDQRGYLRVSGGRIDIGSYESRVPTLNIPDQSVNEGELLNLTITATGLDLPILSVSVVEETLPANAIFAQTSTTVQLTWTPTIAQAPGVYSVTISAFDGTHTTATTFTITAVEVGAYEVTTASDVLDPADGQTSLREAIIAANDKPGPDTITFDMGLSVGVINVSVSSALPHITDPVTIDGTTSGKNTPIIQINGLQSGGTKLAATGLFFAVGSGSSTIRGLEITNFGGGGISNYGTLTIEDSTISGNSTTASGGGIYNAGTVNVTNSTLSGNSANWRRWRI